MRAILLTSFEDTSRSLKVQEIPKPVLLPGQVLVRMAAASINPADLVFLRNKYGIQKALPVVPGFEGSGTVVESRGSLYGRWLVGKRVATHAPTHGNGTWAEYMACRAIDCIPLKRRTTFEQGAAFYVNPFTAHCLLERARIGGHRAIIQTAAASALGRMIGRLARRQKVQAIHIVRRPEQVALLQREGFRLIVDSSQPDFHETLRRLAVQIHATLAFDSVGGALTGTLADAMPRTSEIVLYGALNGDACAIQPADLIFKEKKLSGFWLPKEIQKMSWLARFRMVSRVKALIATDLATDVQARFPLEGIHEALALYKKQRSAGKVQLVMKN